MNAIRVLLINDHTLFQKNVAELLASERDFQLVGEANDKTETLEMARELMPDVVLMDLSMPRMAGWRRRRIKRSPCVGSWSQRLERRHSSCGSVKSGAHGYLSKSVKPQALLDTVGGSPAARHASRRTPGRPAPRDSPAPRTRSARQCSNKSPGESHGAVAGIPGVP
jgi:DNA-binding NarL/FixJ family response regulator